MPENQFVEEIKRMIFSAIDLALEDGYSEKQKIVGPVDEDYGVEERVAV